MVYKDLLTCIEGLKLGLKLIVSQSMHSKLNDLHSLTC